VVASLALPLARRLAPPLAALLIGSVAQAQTAACRVDPFGTESAADRAALLTRGCGGEHIDYRLETPRNRPTDPGPSRIAAQVDVVATRPLLSGLLATLQLNWSAAGSEDSDRLLRTERTVWAAGTWWRLSRQWAVQMNVGREFTVAPRTRATLAGIWRPIRSALLFAEWAGNTESTEGQRVGLRWWLVRNRLVLEAGARRLADLGWAERQVTLSFGALR
jgi:hypothetical protein